MHNRKKALFGFGGHAREVAAHINEEVDFFVDDAFVNKNAKSIKHFNFEQYELLVAIGDSHTRSRIVNSLSDKINYFSFIHNSTIILNKKSIVINNGTFIGSNCILTDNIKIGSHCLLNRSINIGHDVNLHDFVSLMPGVIISGNVEIKHNVYIGSGTVINENITITSNVVIGSNSTVINNVDKPGVYAGNPIKLICE